MIILEHIIKPLKDGKGKEHEIFFEFESKRFAAIVVAAKDAFYVAECMLLEDRTITEIDIPVYFGIGFAAEVEALLFNKALEKKGQNYGYESD